ncbi:RHS repeat domain-containing protein [Paradesertivirga mongoliensis]|uniref:RHS repeat domain-containing protein n=1 Tax=Paradesertivirga mongoliensis TaxID=2100740 RepID=A0ABW4ZL38_9SPHI|nr:RHS repeat domain-containing protein [Pedobacter mongoliensis]
MKKLIGVLLLTYHFMKFRSKRVPFKLKEMLGVVFLLFQFALLYGQNLPDQAPPSPSTMMFQKYGDYPVSYYTGIPDIKVPIYTIQEGDITVPIYLSFHASGLNLDERQGNVGPGWTLHTGGMVSRTINGVADEHFGNFVIPDWSKDYHPNDYRNYKYRYQDMYDDYNNYYSDHELDVYSYNFLGKSGKFIPYAHFLQDPDGLQPYDPFKLKEDDVWIKSIGHMVDENGVEYFFGGNAATEMQDFTAGPLGWQYSAASTWHLTQILSSRQPGRAISYTYQNGWLYPFQESRKWVMDDFYNDEYDPYGAPHFLMSGILPHSHTGERFPLTNRYNRHYTVFPQRISFSSGYLLFFLNSFKYLERIEIYDNKNQLLRKVELLGGNFSTTEDSGRPFRRLDAVVFKDANSIEQERYSFTYHNAGQAVTWGKDLWGFYNGRSWTGDYTVPIPNLTQLWTINLDGSFSPIYFHPDLNYRQVNAWSAQTYMLQRITYPTGGFTDFDYEGNAGNGKTYGGLRIKDIRSYAKDGHLAKHKTYTYSSPWIELDVTPQLFLEHSGILVGISGGGSVSSRRRTISGSAPVTLFPKGAPVGYYHITESEGEISTDYYFDDYQAYEYEELGNQSNSFPGDGYEEYRTFAHHYRPWNFGDLISKVTTGPGYHKTELFDYESFEKDTVHDVVMNQSVFHIDIGGNSSDYFHRNVSCFYNFANRYHHSGVKRLREKLVSEQGADGLAVWTSEAYTYSNPNRPMQVTSTLQTNSKQEAIRKNLTYANNYSGPVYDKLVEQNRVGEPIEQVVINETQNNKEISRVKSEYDFFNPANATGTAQVTQIKKSVGGNPLEIREVADKYDANGHILQQTDEGGGVTSFIYGYQSQLLVAVVKNADHTTASSLVNSTIINSLNTSDEDMRNALSALRTGLPSAQTTTYTYKPLIGMTSMTNARGQTTTYEYDSFQRLSTIKDHSGSIVKQYCYNYAGQQTTCYSVSLPGVSNTGGTGPQTIYARAEYDGQTGDYGYNGDLYYSYWSSDLYFRFYSDAACTQPYTLASSVNVYYSNTSEYNYNGGSSQSTYSSSIQVPSGSNSFYFGNVETSYYEEYAWDPDWGYLYDSYTYYDYLTPGAGYEPQPTISIF